MSPRRSGVLLHPTSLAGPPGIGDLGDAAHAFLEALAGCRQRLWQMLPLGPTGFGDSPYQALSAFAGNPLVVSLDRLAADGLLPADAPGRVPAGDAARVDFGAVIPAKKEALLVAWRAFSDGRGSVPRDEWEEFREAERDWLDDYALFAALHEREGRAWWEWPAPLARRNASALAEARAGLSAEVDRIAFVQFLFRRQWNALRTRATELEVELVGDLPIFVAHDSADAWAQQELFDLDEAGRPKRVAGAPPDDFTADGQRWGNPIYRWDVMEERGFDWWVRRLRHTFRTFDRVRVDHFRGFAAGWTIDAAEKTARKGRWDPGPGERLFDRVREELGELNLIAEDLGDITDDVRELRDRLGFPGMKILVFGFEGDPAENEFAPHRYERNCVAYTGTHDNETVRGWWTEGLEARHAADAERIRARVRRYAGSDGSEIHWDFVRMAHTSVADTVVVPMQDLLGLGNEARMNVPGRPDGNWTWRLDPDGWDEESRERLGNLTEASGRAG